MYIVTEECKGCKAYYRVTDVKSQAYDTWMVIDLDNATQSELKLLCSEKGGHPFIKEVDKKSKASD